ncbi:MAG: substrate-binding domain-containing protein [Candidatus Ratteibacteria bacterium]
MENKKELILKIGEKIISEKGYTKTTIDEIAKKSGIGKGTFYLYFKNKEDLFLSIIENGLEISFFISERVRENNDFLDKFDGILYLIPMRDEVDILEIIKKKNKQLMIIGARVDGFNYVAVDNKKGVEEAIKHLIEYGHRKIGGIFFPISYFDGYERYRYFIETIERYNLVAKEGWIKIMKEYWAENWKKEAKELMREILKEKEKPSVIFCSSALATIGVKELLDEEKEKISLIGFDDFYLARYLKPPITVISQPVWDIGRNGINKLVEIIEKGGKCELLLEPILIIRKSVKREEVKKDEK